MRNPERIDGVLAALGAYWKKNPDLRLGQIVSNAPERARPNLRQLDDWGDALRRAIFNIEDDELARAIDPRPPRKHALAYCSKGHLGVITSEGPESVEYPDGTKGMAWTGYHLPDGRPWSSRNPRVVGYLDNLADKHFGIDNEEDEPEPEGCPQRTMAGGCKWCGAPAEVECDNVHRPNNGVI